MQLQVFKYEESDHHFNDIRSIEVEGVFWFSAKDVATVLGYKGSLSETVNRHCKPKGIMKHDTLTSGGMQKVMYLSEANIYRLTVKSQLPTVERFEAWLFEEVLPSIRKTGSYVGIATKPLLNTYTSRILSEPTKNCPKGFWNIFDKSHKVMLMIEKHIGSVNKYDLADGSIGIRWSAYREGKHWAVEPSWFTYVHADNRGEREARCYRYSEIEYFEEWLCEIYIPRYLHEYLISKYKRDKDLTMLDRVYKAMPKLLGKTG